MSLVKKHKKKLLKELAKKTQYYWDDCIQLFELMDDAGVDMSKIPEMNEKEESKLIDEFDKLQKSVLRKMLK